MEEQALARIYRIGQEREVVTVRFYIRDSFEMVRQLQRWRRRATLLILRQQVLQIQDTKKQLARLFLSPHDRGQGDDSLGSLHACVSWPPMTLSLLTCGGFRS